MENKKCFKCGIDKPLSEFYKHKEMADGYLGKCKQCAKTDVLNHRWANIEKIREYDRGRPRDQAKRTKQSKSWRGRYPERYAAHSLLGRALKTKRIVKPKICSECKKEGRRISGHHEDYYKPLEVVWLCDECHHERHASSTACF